MGYERTLTLRSAIATLRDFTTQPEDFTFTFNPPLNLQHLSNKNLKVSLTHFSGSYSWFNVSEVYGNNKIQYSINEGVTVKDIIFPDGIFDYDDLNSFIHHVLKENKDFSVDNFGKETYPINLFFDSTRYKVFIKLDKSTVLDLRLSRFHELIGFDKVVINAGYHSGSMTPNITFSLDNVYVHCDLINDSITDGRGSDIIFDFSVDSLTPSFPFSFNPFHLDWHTLSKHDIRSVHIYLTDVYGYKIPLNGNHISCKLLIKEFSDETA